MEKYVIEALYQMQRPDQAIARLKKRYGKMVAADTATLCKGWGMVEARSTTLGPVVRFRSSWLASIRLNPVLKSLNN